MLIIETVILCILFFGICYINTGSDEKNIKSFKSYPDEIQEIVKKNSELNKKVKVTTPVKSFIANIIVFVVVFLLFGYFLKEKDFVSNFISILILCQCLNAFDFFIIDMLWWRNTKRVRFSGTENMDKVYKSPKKHLISFLKGIIMFSIIAVIDGFILALI